MSSDTYFEDIRREYMSRGISRDDLAQNPFTQFDNWMQSAIEAGVDMPNAMSLATSDEFVSIRTVLLKSFDEHGFVFFTNYSSTKAKQIEQSPKVGLLFPWLALDRQVKISGTIQKISTAESLKYFLTRPLDSRIAAACSDQSSVVSSRQKLIDGFNELKKMTTSDTLPLPKNWGGYVVIPERIEFWQGRENRLHDRFLYTLSDNSWQINRLNP